MPTGDQNGRDPDNGADFLARGTGNQQINEWNSQYNVLMNAMEMHNGGNGVTNAQNGGGAVCTFKRRGQEGPEKRGFNKSDPWVI